MLADPITVPAAAPTPALNLYIVRSDQYGSERRHDGTDRYSAIINHTTTKEGDRHYLQIAKEVDAVSPFTGLTSRQRATASITFTVPKFGFDQAAIVALVKALTDTLADADVTTAKLYNFQS